MSVLTHPETIPTPTDDGPDMVHVMCCNESIGMCGTAIGRVAADDDEVDCPLCAIADAEDLPCGDLRCPWRVTS